MRKIAAWCAAAWWCSLGIASAEIPSREFTTQTKTASVSSTATDTTLWTPASGKRIILQGVIACAAGPVTTVEIEEDDGTDVIPPFGLPSYGCHTFGAGGSALWMGDPDEFLTYSVVTGVTVSITAWGYEIQ